MIAFILQQKWIAVGLASLLGLFILLVYDAYREPPLVQYFRENNVPTNIEELKAMYPLPPDDENGFSLILEAIEKYWEEDDDTYDQLPFPGNEGVEYGEPLTELQLAAMRTYIDRNAETLSLIIEAMKYPYLRMPHDRYDPDDVKYLSDMRSLARLLYCAAYDAALTRDLELLEHTVIASLKLYEPTGYGADILAEFVSIALAGWALESIQNVLGYTSIPPDSIHNWMEILNNERYKELNNFQQALKNEIARELPLIQYGGPSYDTARPFDAWKFLIPVTFEWGQLSFLGKREYVQRFTQVIEVGNNDIYEATRFSFQEITGIGSLVTAFMPSFLTYYNYNIYLPRVQFIAQATTTRTALAALLFHHDQGYMPNTLEALVPEYLDTLPRDPFMPDQPIQYRMEQEAVVFYSAGRDGIYGKQANKDCDCTDDIEFHLKIPQNNIPLEPNSKDELKNGETSSTGGQTS